MTLSSLRCSYMKQQHPEKYIYKAGEMHDITQFIWRVICGNAML